MRILVFLILLLISVVVLPFQLHPALRGAEAASALPSDMPVVFVDPPVVVADPGETFTITVNIFNLSGDFRTTVDAWVEGEPLPPSAPDLWLYNYSLGYLYAIDLRLKWDPTVLEYVSHTVTVPVETYADGVLHAPVMEVLDTVDPVAGTYWLARSSQAPAPAFNARDMNATAFTMTFTVKRTGRCSIDFTNVDLAVHYFSLKLPRSVPLYVPHWTRNGTFQTRNRLTRIERVQGGAVAGGSLHYPAIEGEDMAIRVTMKNDNDTALDVFNLSLYDGPTLLNVWEDESLAPDSTRTLNYTVEGPTTGTHAITAEASILHEGVIITDTLQQNMTVVAVPTLAIVGPTSATTGTTVDFSASGSVHNDPDGVITIYTWTLWTPGETLPRSVQSGESVSFQLPPETAKPGNWTVMLVVEDSFGITAQPLTGGTLAPSSELLRPATAPYRQLWALNVQNPGAVDYDLRWPMLSGSMRPTLEVLDFVYVQNVSGHTDVHASYSDGDIILFHKPGDPGELIIHRAVEEVQWYSVWYFKTKGDNNVAADYWNVSESEVVGKVVALSRTVSVGSYNVTVFSTCTFTDVNLNVTRNALEINVGTPLTQSVSSSFLNITIPNALVTGELEVLVDGAPSVFEYSANSTHHCVWVDWDGVNYTAVVILPEFASFSILPLFTLTALLASRAYKKRRARS